MKISDLLGKKIVAVRSAFPAYRGVTDRAYWVELETEDGVIALFSGLSESLDISIERKSND